MEACVRPHLADCIIPWIKTSLDFITYKINSKFLSWHFKVFIPWPQTFFFPSLSFITSLYMPVNDTDWPPNILHCPLAHTLSSSLFPTPCFIIPLKTLLNFKMFRIKPSYNLPWFLGRLLPNAWNFFQLWITVNLAVVAFQNLFQSMVYFTYWAIFLEFPITLIEV